MTIIGTLNIRDWDKGCYLTIEAEVVEYDVDGDTRGQYCVTVPGLDSGIEKFDGKVPVFFDAPEDVYQNFILPCIVFKQNSLSPAFERQPWYSWVESGPAKGANKIVLEDGTVGYDRYENQWRPTPFDISYDCTLMTRRKQEGNLMLTYALRRFIPPWFIFKVIDTLGDVREYDAGDMSISNVAELVDIAERMAGWTISFTVRGEIDIHDDHEEYAMIDRQFRYTQEQGE